MAKSIILASGNIHRRDLLKNAGIHFAVRPSWLDERSIEAPLLGTVDAEDIAAVRAEAKAMDVSERLPGKLVIGADQTLSLGDELLHRPGTMEEARRTLLKLSGRTHRLNSAVVLVEDGVPNWRHIGVASITFRELDPGFVGRYLARAGESVLTSGGAYQVEGQGIHLIERIEGDHSTIVGLPLLPLLKELRERGEIDG